MRRAITGALVLTLFLGLVLNSAVASDLEALWMSATPEGPAQTDFPSGVQTVYIVFEYTDFISENVRAVVSDYRGATIFQTTQVFSGSGVGSIPVTYEQGAFPDGPYVTTLYFAGQYLTRAVEWTVGGMDAPPMPTPFPPPRLEVQPADLTFSAEQGGVNPPTQRVLVSNSTASASVWWATADAPWIELTPIGGETPALLRVGVDSTGLPAGTYTGHVRVEADGIEGSPQIIAVRLDVSAPAGTVTLNLPAVPEGTGWVVSTETAGNHFGTDEVRVGTRAGQAYLGSLQFDLSEIPDESALRAAAVLLPGVGWEVRPSGGEWVLELLDADLAEGWADASYSEVASPTARVVLVPNYGVDHLSAGSESVWHFGAAGLDVLQSFIRGSGAAILRLRYEPETGLPAAQDPRAEDALFVWDASGILRINFDLIETSSRVSGGRFIAR